MCFYGICGENWYYFPRIMFIVMFVMMIFFIIGLYRRRGFLFGRRWFGCNWAQNSFTGDRGIESASDLLKKRYVKGEITKEEYEQIKKDI